MAITAGKTVTVLSLAGAKDQLRTFYYEELDKRHQLLNRSKQKLVQHPCYCWAQLRGCSLGFAMIRWALWNQFSMLESESLCVPPQERSMSEQRSTQTMDYLEERPKPKIRSMSEQRSTQTMDYLEERPKPKIRLASLLKKELTVMEHGFLTTAWRY
eukprot:s1311_g4.t1